MFFQEIFKNNFEALIPEFFIIVTFLTLLIFCPLYQSTGIFKKSHINVLSINIATYALILTSLLIFNLTYPEIRQPLANGSLISHTLQWFVKIIIIYTSVICLNLQKPYLKNQHLNRFENTILLLISLLGLMLLNSVNNLLSLYVAIEIQSLSFYILTASQSKSSFSAEAAIKYFILGAIASSFILLGSAFIYYFTGSLNFHEILIITTNLPYEISITILLIGIMLLYSGLFFKIGLAPFHFWLPDVYEGSPNNVTTIFAVLPKIVYISLLTMLNYTVFLPFKPFFQHIFLITGFLSILVGALSAINQKKFKRLFAYSSVVHSGFIILGFSAITFNFTPNIILYIFVYTITGIVFWGVVSSIFINLKPIKFITDLTGMFNSNKILFFCLTVSLFSAAGIPPLAGFFAKMFILVNVLASKAFITAGGVVILSALSAFYYLRLVKTVYFDKRSVNLIIEPINKFNSTVITFNTVLLIVFCFWPEFIMNWLTKINLYVFY